MAGNRIAFCGKCGCYLMHEPVSLLPYTRETLPVFLSSKLVEGIAMRCFWEGLWLTIDGGNGEYEDYDGDFGSWYERFCKCTYE
jgi:hypothetical protein